MTTTIQSTRSAYIKLSLFVFLFTFTWAASFGLYAIWLGDKAGLDAVDIGTVFAVNGVFAVVIKPVYGYIMDKIGMKKHLLYFVCIVSALMAPFYIWIYLPLLQTHFISGMIVGALFFSLGCMPAWRRKSRTSIALVASTTWNLAASACGRLSAGPRHHRSPDSCITFRPRLTLPSAASRRCVCSPYC